jgi:hypothetical protein
VPTAPQFELPLLAEPSAAGDGPGLPASPRSPSELLARLRSLGLHQVERLSLHRNRTVMVSLTPAGTLRLHGGYAYAPDSVLEAIARFLRRGTRRADRMRHRQTLLAFPVEQFLPPIQPLRRRPEAAAPGDEAALVRIGELHAALNREYFESRLEAIPIRLSGRMRRRLGELRIERRTGAALEIVLSRRHLKRDGWTALRDTLLHEMIHQWQAESSLPVDHGREFRLKAKAVGVEPRAVRVDG